MIRPTSWPLSSTGSRPEDHTHTTRHHQYQVTCVAVSRFTKGLGIELSAQRRGHEALTHEPAQYSAAKLCVVEDGCGEYPGCAFLCSADVLESAKNMYHKLAHFALFVEGCCVCLPMSFSTSCSSTCARVSFACTAITVVNMYLQYRSQ